MEQRPAATAKTPALAAPPPHPAVASRPATWRPEPGWRDLLTGQCPKTLFERIGEAGDPLRLRQLCALRMRERSLLLDLDRIHLRGLARVVATVLTRGRPNGSSVLVDEVDLAISDVRRDDALLSAAAGQGGGPGAAKGPHAVFAEPFGLTEAQFRRACAAFNRRPRTEREAFFAMVIERRSMEAAGEALRVPALHLAGRARAVLESILDAVGGTGEVAR